jgi:hypothetical protein
MADIVYGGGGGGGGVEEGGGWKGEGGRELEVGGCVLWMCDVAFFLGAYMYAPVRTYSTLKYIAHQLKLPR